MAETNETNTGGGGGASVLRPASVRLLYDGMVVTDDIYDAGKDRLLMKGGNTLTADLIERINRINGGNDTIYVTGNTYNTMVSKRPNIEIAKRTDLENSTVYAAVLAEVRQLYDDTAETKKVNINRFTALAADLSGHIETTEPSITISLINAPAPEVQYLPRHAVNVALLSGLMAAWLGLPGEQVKSMVLIGLLHDCGQALMPPPILHGSHKITVLESEVIKTHPLRAGELLAGCPDDIRGAAISHHERLDGSGYPQGISGNAINGAARMITVADIYEAIVATRAYRPLRSPFCALDILSGLAPAQVDSNIVSAICKNLPPELIGKPVTLSDGTIGIVRECSPDNIQYPKVEVTGRIIQTNSKLYCVSMFYD